MTRKVYNMRVVGSLTLALIPVGVLLFVTGPARAATIDFTSLPADYAVTNQFAGVTFSLVGGIDAAGPPTTTSDAQGTSMGGLTNTRWGGSYPTAEFLVATFSAPVTDVVFSFFDAGFNGANSYTLYDASHSVITSALMPEADTSSYTYNLSSFTGVSEISWDNGTPDGNWWQDLQSLSFTPSAVPEPSTWTVLSSALLGLLFLRRKRV